MKFIFGHSSTIIVAFSANQKPAEVGMLILSGTNLKVTLYWVILLGEAPSAVPE